MEKAAFTKPIVFLSHSSKDKTVLCALKTLLDERAAGSLELFLSSDGESIRFGRNWVTRVSDALGQAKLMFVFLSASSAASKWIHFEAGCAYGNDIRVVPVCLPGLDLDHVNAPLNLLQGFNLHSAEAMANLSRICNEVFGLRMGEVFTKQDFDTVFSGSKLEQEAYLGAFSWAVEKVEMALDNTVPEAEPAFNPLPKLQELAKDANIHCSSVSWQDFPGHLQQQIDLPGCVIHWQQHLTGPRKQPNPHRETKILCTMSAELMHLNVPLLDKWCTEVKFPCDFRISLHFKDLIAAEDVRHRLTAKLFNTGIRPIDRVWLDFGGICFCLVKQQHWWLTFRHLDRLSNKQLPKLIDQLFSSGVLFEAPVDPSLISLPGW